MITTAIWISLTTLLAAFCGCRLNSIIEKKTEKKDTKDKIELMRSLLPIEFQNKVYEKSIEKAKIEAPEMRFMCAYYFRLGAEYTAHEFSKNNKL